jgi:hypothetical protein
MRVFLSVLAGMFLLASACDDSPTGPTTADVAGSYEATTLTVTDGGTTTDALAEGASIAVTLDGDGTTSGTFVVPGSMSESGEEEVLDLEGSWTLEGRNVSLDHEADTFLRDMTFEVGDGRLEGEETFGSETVRVVLER